LLALIGPNGAGKTCLLNCISGFYRPQTGNIFLNGQSITSLPAHQIAQLGIARTFQNIALYTALSSVDNLMAARHMHFRHKIGGLIYFGPARREEIRHRKVVENVIDFLDMESIRKTVVGSLPYGHRKKVELGRALAMEPEVLLLDEPMAGMNLEEKEDMARYILDTCQRLGIATILVEHDMRVVMDISDRVVVLDFGEKIAEGSPEEIKTDERVMKAYLGKPG